MTNDNQQVKELSYHKKWQNFCNLIEGREDYYVTLSLYHTFMILIEIACSIYYIYMAAVKNMYTEKWNENWFIATLLVSVVHTFPIISFGVHLFLFRKDNKAGYGWMSYGWFYLIPTLVANVFTWIGTGISFIAVDTTPSPKNWVIFMLLSSIPTFAFILLMLIYLIVVVCCSFSCNEINKVNEQYLKKNDPANRK